LPGEGRGASVAAFALFTTLGFAGLYFVLGVLFLLLVLREIHRGPAEAH